MKYFPFLVAAAVMDGLQGGIVFGFSGTMMGISTFFGWIPFIGQALAGGTTLLSTYLGFAIASCLSLVFGAGIITLLIFNKFNKSSHLFYMFGVYIAELIPGIGIAPSWTGMTFALIRKKIREDKSAKEALTVEKAQADEEPSIAPEQKAPQARSVRVDGIQARENYAS